MQDELSYENPTVPMELDGISEVLFITAPLEGESRGDTDYVNEVLEALYEKGIKAEFVNGRCAHPGDGEELYDTAKLYDSIIVDGVKEQCYKHQNSEYRLNAMRRLREFISAKVKSSTKQSTAIHLQLRAPETGCMIHPGEIDGLKECVGKFFVTCHEWCHSAIDLTAREGDDKQRFDKIATRIYC